MPKSFATVQYHSYFIHSLQDKVSIYIFEEINFGGLCDNGSVTLGWNETQELSFSK
jgi:hypothetical protein